MELALRIKGRQPFRSFAYESTSGFQEADAVLGWKNKPGVYSKWPSSWGDGKRIKVTIWPGGLRATQASRLKKDKQIVILGCSFTNGYAISDEETFTWKLQERFPEIEFLNYGTAGYGTYQALLLLRQQLEDSLIPPAMVWYGFCDFHAERNVAQIDWLRACARFKSKFRFFMPYCLIDAGGRLRKYVSFGYPLCLLSKYSVAVDYLQLRCLRLLARNRESQQEAVTRRLLLEMDALCASKGVKLIVLFLASGDKNKNKYAQFFLENNITFIDCIPQSKSLNWVVKNENLHPNDKLNSYWADCITNYLKDNLLVKR